MAWPWSAVRRRRGERRRRETAESSGGRAGPAHRYPTPPARKNAPDLVETPSGGNLLFLFPNGKLPGKESVGKKTWFWRVELAFPTGRNLLELRYLAPQNRGFFFCITNPRSSRPTARNDRSSQKMITSLKRGRPLSLQRHLGGPEFAILVVTAEHDEDAERCWTIPGPPWTSVAAHARNRVPGDSGDPRGPAVAAQL
eukprot:gene23510-biopygen13372